ncbi:MAG: universal stress protein [Microthrixaceae bacterium]
MNETSRIVVGIDQSPDSLGALDFAIEEAALRRAELEVIWAWSDKMPKPATSGDQTDMVDIGARAQLQLDEVVLGRVPEGVAVTTRAIVAKPEAALLESGGFADMLVVGARGEGGFMGLQLGSVSLKVASRSTCPVVVVRGLADGPVADTEARIVVGVDGSKGSRNALRWALNYAAVHGLPVVAVNAWAESVTRTPYPGLGVSVEAIEASAKELLDSEIELAARDVPAVTVHARTESCNGATALIEASAGASLVVVGSRGHSDFLGNLLGSVTQQVLRHARCSTVVVPPG